MLVLQRHVMDSSKREVVYSQIVLDVREPCRIVVTLADVRGPEKARIGVDAPMSVEIHRGEVRRLIDEERGRTGQDSA